MADANKPEKTRARNAAGRAMLASGILFAVLVLIGMSGLASVTLFMAETDGGLAHDDFEGTVISIVRFLDGWFQDGTRLHILRHIHNLGSYLAIVLSGWAVLELWSAAGMLKANANAEVRFNARFMRAPALVGGIFLAGSLLALIISGAATRAILDEMRAPVAVDQPASVVESRRFADAFVAADGDFAQTKDDAIVKSHMNQWNYPMGFGALLILISAVLARRAAIALDAEPKSGVDVSISKV